MDRAADDQTKLLDPGKKTYSDQTFFPNDAPPRYEEAQIGYRHLPAEHRHQASFVSHGYQPSSQRCHRTPAVHGYQAPPAINGYQHQVVQPNIAVGTKPTLVPHRSRDFERKMYIGIVLGVIGLCLSGLMTIPCTVPLLICVIMTMTAKNEEEKEACAKQSLYGGVCALISGAVCIGLVLAFIIVIGVLRGLWISNNSYDE